MSNCATTKGFLFGELVIILPKPTQGVIDIGQICGVIAGKIKDVDAYVVRTAFYTKCVPIRNLKLEWGSFSGKDAILPAIRLQKHGGC